MYTHVTRSAAALHAKAKRIPIHHSTRLRMRPKKAMAMLAVLAALVFMDAGVSVAHAETADATTPVTLAQQSRQGGDRPARPPREALEACTDQTSGSACGFSGRDGQKITGTCRSPQANVPLACAPAERPQNG